MPVVKKREMIKPVFVIETEEKQERFRGDPKIPEHMRSTSCNIFKYKLSTLTNGLRLIQQEHDLLDTLDNISGVTVFCEVHDLEFVSLLTYRLCNVDGLYGYPVNWFLLMNSAIYEKLLLINKGYSKIQKNVYSYKIFFHALHKCSARKLVSTGSKSTLQHPVLLHVTPNYELLHQLKVERKFFKVFLRQIGHKKSLILPFVESMLSESTEVVRPLLETQYTRVCDIHPTKLLEIFVALTNMPEFESSMFKEILYKEQWDEPRIEEDNLVGGKQRNGVDIGK